MCRRPRAEVHVPASGAIADPRVTAAATARVLGALAIDPPLKIVAHVWATQPFGPSARLWSMPRPLCENWRLRPTGKPLRICLPHGKNVMQTWCRQRRSLAAA